jgi:hypothetical protein
MSIFVQIAFYTVVKDGMRTTVNLKNKTSTLMRFGMGRKSLSHSRLPVFIIESYLIPID